MGEEKGISVWRVGQFRRKQENAGEGEDKKVLTGTA